MFSARCRPGQTLHKEYVFEATTIRRRKTYRRPNPKATVDGSLTDESSWPSFMKRSGMKSSGSGYKLGSWNMDLRVLRSVCHSDPQFFAPAVPYVNDDHAPLGDEVPGKLVICGAHMGKPRGAG